MLLHLFSQVINDLLDPAGQNLRIREDPQVMSLMKRSLTINLAQKIDNFHFKVVQNICLCICIWAFEHMYLRLCMCICMSYIGIIDYVQRYHANHLQKHFFTAIILERFDVAYLPTNRRHSLILINTDTLSVLYTSRKFVFWLKRITIVVSCNWVPVM